METSCNTKLKYLSHTQWGGEEQTLVRIHRQLICRSKIDGSVIYQSISHPHIKILDIIGRL
jgi:hypothetical protein